MEIKINLDTDSYKKLIESQIKQRCENTIKLNTDEFFRSNQYTEKKGIGYLAIEEMIAAKFMDPQFEAKMNKYFEENWEHIFEAAMEKALFFKAKGIAFNRIKRDNKIGE